MAHQGKPMCEQCYYQEQGLICRVCGEHISGDYIEIESRKYHVHCKRCSLCDKPLAGRQYFLLSSSPLDAYCSECTVKMVQPTAAASTQPVTPTVQHNENATAQEV